MTPSAKRPATQQGWGFLFFFGPIIFSFSIKGEETRSNSSKTVPRQRKVVGSTMLGLCKAALNREERLFVRGDGAGGCSQGTQRITFMQKPRSSKRKRGSPSGHPAFQKHSPADHPRDDGPLMTSFREFHSTFVHWLSLLRFRWIEKTKTSSFTFKK